MGVEVRGPGQDGVEEGDQVAGVNTPIILRLVHSLHCTVSSSTWLMPYQFLELKILRSFYTEISSSSAVRSADTQHET